MSDLDVHNLAYEGRIDILKGKVRGNEAPLTEKDGVSIDEHVGHNSFHIRVE